jgi:GNAT superfamily N-acetyltransferase
MTPTTLPNGSVVQVRPIKPTDKQLLLDAFERLGEESRFRSFPHPVKRLTDNELAYFTEADQHDHEALVAVGDQGTEPIGVARYVRLAEPEVAEVAIAVVNHGHGQGVGTLLLHELAGLARDAGIRQLQATCLADSAGVIDLLHRLGTAWEDHPEPGLVELTIDVSEKVLPASELRAALRAAASRKLEAVTG